jgi:hypothetical protein
LVFTGLIGKKPNLDDILPFILDGIILTVDFNPSMKEWIGTSKDTEEACMKE